MRIVGKWHRCDDGVSRPVVEAKIPAADGQLVSGIFLVDTCADCTVFSADLFERLKLLGSPPPKGLSLQGIGGASGIVVVSTTVELTLESGGTARLRGEFAAFTDQHATDLSVLGRNVLDSFDVIVSKRRNEVLLLAGNCQYRVDNGN
jgi:hypothetical protein